MSGIVMKPTRIDDAADCVLYPQLQPMCDDWEYLENQHLLLAVKTADGLESYGYFSVVMCLRVCCC